MVDGARVRVCRDETFTLGERTLVVGIVNVTPDSFSDGAMFATAADAVAHGARLVDEGADLVDVGGSRPGPVRTRWTSTRELRRVVPVIEGLAKARPGTLISVDTREAGVAMAALDAGAAPSTTSLAGGDAKLPRDRRAHRAPGSC